MALGAGVVLAASISVVALLAVSPGAGHRPAHRAGPSTATATTTSPTTPAGSASALGRPDVLDARHQAVPTAGAVQRPPASDPGRGPHPVALGATPKGWTTLAVMTGTGEGHSAVFHLSGVDTQLRYASDSSSLVV